MYTPHTWVADETITAEKLNHIESGISPVSFAYGSDSTMTTLENSTWEVVGNDHYECEVQGYVYGNPDLPLFAFILNPDGRRTALYEAERYTEQGNTIINMSSPVFHDYIDEVFVSLQLNDKLLLGTAVAYIH